jgi:dihydrofolate synthase/folylpolyglutamate synthase
LTLRKNPFVPTYTETLDFLYGQLPMFQRQGKPAFKKDLTNTLALCQFLGNPFQRFRSIHIAGTNGKGSVAHMLSAVLQAHGFQVGLYTSPHYVDFRERIKINGTYISEAEVVEFVQRIRPALHEGLQPSFFEMTVAMAFDHFARHEVDVAVIETGLGGRLDSTNVVTPELSVITNISFDHMEFLGNTLPLIAGEKAGIIKRGVPVVIGERQQETTPVFQSKARELDAPISWAEDKWQVEAREEQEDLTTYEVQFEGNTYLPGGLQLDVSGPFQSQNLITSLEALHQLDRSVDWFQLEETALRQGFSNIRKLAGLMGRWQWLSEAPRILVDSAHNEGGLRIVMRRIQTLNYDQLHFVLGVTREKDLKVLFPLLSPNAIYYFAKADIPRGLSAVTLQEEANAFGLPGQAYSSVKEALAAAKKAAGKEDLIFVGGSIFTVAEVLD